MKNFNQNKLEEIKHLDDGDIESLTLVFDRALLNGTTMEDLLDLSCIWSKKLKVECRDRTSINAHIRARKERGLRLVEDGNRLQLIE